MAARNRHSRLVTASYDWDQHGTVRTRVFRYLILCVTTDQTIDFRFKF
jgi:hypothetical protein